MIALRSVVRLFSVVPFLLAVPALAQTMADGPPPPDSVLEQAEQQQEGIYGHLVRPRTAGQIQRVWDKAGQDIAAYTTAACSGCTYKVRVREWMVTVIELPRGESIDTIDLGDTRGFQVARRGGHRLAVRPVGHGYDTNMVVYGKSGAVYPFYLRAEGFNSTSAPDLLVRIDGMVPGPAGEMTVADTRPADGPATIQLASLSSTLPGIPPVPAPKDFVREVPFDPSKLRGWGEYRLSGSDDSLKPETVFRDDYFTYIRFGDRWKEIELPTAYVVVDDVDELVNTRVVGETYIIESTRPRITLKSGKSWLCITHEGRK